MNTNDELNASNILNEHGQPVGNDLGAWTPPPRPPHDSLVGRTVRLDPLDAGQHAGALTRVFLASPDDVWTYLPWGPFAADDKALDRVTRMIDGVNALADWQSYAIVVDDEPLGMMSYLRIDPNGGVIEIGGIIFSAALQQTTAATEALYLMIKNSFDVGYRRCEWKCDDLNAPSRSAALRLGFTYEGTFRQATHYKGRSRDTAWFGIIDGDWPALDQSFTSWLSTDNFDADGRQRQSLQHRSRPVEDARTRA